MLPRTLADDMAQLPQANAPATDLVVASLSARQGRLLLLAAEFLRFGTVGGLGLLWDVSTFYVVRPFLGFTIATLASFLVAATMNWILNRLWTFRGPRQPGQPVSPVAELSRRQRTWIHAQPQRPVRAGLVQPVLLRPSGGRFPPAARWPA